MLQKKGNWWVLDIDLSQVIFPVAYKYGVYDFKKEEFIRFEDGDNRVLHYDIPANKRTIIHDGFIRLPNTVWKGTGLAIPVFSLRSNNSFGVGEFADMKLLVDWAQEIGLKLIQILPVNDTSATYSWKDSYPYAAISAFALHPIYINLQKVAGKKNAGIIKSLSRKQKQLNNLTEIDYEQVIQFKINVLRELFFA
jgi:4-alpha-glucanotransferase